MHDLDLEMVIFSWFSSTTGNEGFIFKIVLIHYGPK